MTKNTITLTFSSTAGDLEDEFPSNQPLGATKKAVMGRLNLDPSQADEFIVVKDGNPLDESKTLKELNLSSGDVLTIERKEVVKI